MLLKSWLLQAYVGVSIIHVWEFLKNAYLSYFGVHLRDQDETAAPQTTKKVFETWDFSVMKEAKNNFEYNSYFCLVNIKGINRNNGHK